MNILIPMAGNGSRFVQAGCKVPKPLIKFDGGKTMIEHVINNLQYDKNKDKITFIIQKQHQDNWKLATYLTKTFPKCQVIQIQETTEGAACTCLLAESYINPYEELLIANCDQIIEWNKQNFDVIRFLSGECDGTGIILTDYSINPNNSYVEIEDNHITKTAEKQLISNIATAGIYYFRKFELFRTAATKMIQANDRTNNEFYVCPTYNYMSGWIVPFFVKYHTIGTPEDLLAYLKPLGLDDDYYENF